MVGQKVKKMAMRPEFGVMLWESTLISEPIQTPLQHNMVASIVRNPFSNYKTANKCGRWMNRQTNRITLAFTMLTITRSVSQTSPSQCSPTA